MADADVCFREIRSAAETAEMRRKQQVRLRLHSGRLKLQSAFPKADIVNKPETRDILPGRYRETSDVQDQHPFWDAT